MAIHKIEKYRYSSTQRYVEAKAKDDTSGFRCFHWGALDAGNVFHPYPRFLCLFLDERWKFLFPEDQDLSVDQNVIAEAHSRLYGGVWLLERIGERLGVREDLLATFACNQAIVDDIMTIAMYVCLTNYNMDRLEARQRIEQYPSKRFLSPPAITEPMKSITEQNRLDFVR